MPLSAAIFDLDDTLLDSSMLRGARDARNWAEVYSRMAEVREFNVAEGQHPIITLPPRAREAGLAVGVLTHSPQQYATHLLHNYGVKVDAMVTGSDGYPTKPDPAGLLAMIGALGVAPEECVYIGDAAGDFGAAAGAGAVSVGVAWDGNAPASWMHAWPDIAVDRPSRLLRFLRGEVGYGTLAEEYADGVDPTPHWGSLLRLGNSRGSLGRYFQTADRRAAGHSLSDLLLKAKNEEAAGDEVADIFRTFTSKFRLINQPEVICSVPPKPDPGRDRFDASRAALADAYGSRDGGGLLEMLFDLPDYKSLPRADRAVANADRFAATERLDGERVLLIDDVLTSGGQAVACRETLQAAGAAGVTILTLAVAQDPVVQHEPCAVCGASMKVRINSHTGEQFLGCSNYGRTGCTFTRNLR